MFTPDFKKLRVSLAAIASVGLVYCSIAVGFNHLAVWAEMERNAYPYKSEDWLRYFTPSFFQARGGKRIMIVGPSAAREAFLIEPISAAFPGTYVFQGALSLGTLDDLNVSLDFIEQTYGAEALPDLLILSLTPRFVANVPDERPFQSAVDQYSRHFSISEAAEGPVLTPKDRWTGGLSWLHFQLAKQTNRYRTAVIAVTLEVLQWGRNYCQDASVFCLPGWPGNMGDWILSLPNTPNFLRFKEIAKLGLDGTLANELAPLKYRHQTPRSPEDLTRMLTKPDTFWREVFAWDPSVNADHTVLKFQRFLRFASDRNIRVIAINMPENEICSALYPPGRHAAYRDLLSRSLSDIPYLDLRAFLSREELLDAVHPTFPGAQRATQRLIEMLKENKVADTLGLMPGGPS